MKEVSVYVSKYYVHFLLTLFLAVWAWSVWDPASPTNWFLENKMVLLFIPIIYFLLIRYIRFSKLSLSLITLFFILHLMGAHYNYGSVPFGFTLSEVSGLGGNMYDKLVHFSFGFLIVYPLRELCLRIAKMKGFWAYSMPFSMVLALGALYEVFEWVTVLQYGEAAGYLFIGGNDPFDTTKDLAVAAVGAVLALGIVLIFEIIEHRGVFWQHFKKSFTRDNRTHPKEDALLHKDII